MIKTYAVYQPMYYVAATASRYKDVAWGVVGLIQRNYAGSSGKNLIKQDGRCGLRETVSPLTVYKMGWRDEDWA